MSQDMKTEHLFLKLSLLFGMLYIFIIPPFQVADEGNHFKKAYLVSNFDFFPKIQDGVYGNDYPKVLLDYENSYSYMDFKIDQKYNYTKFYYDFAQPIDLDEKVFVQYSTSKTHPLLYFPQAAMMDLVKVITLFDHDAMTKSMYLYAGRFGNLLVYILLIYFSIKLTPIYKNLYLMLGIMPMALTSASSVSYDAIVIGITFFITALLLNYAYNKNVEYIDKRKIIILCFLSVLLIELKMVYYPLLLLYFLIPLSKFENKKNYILKFVYIISSAVVTHLVWLLFSRTTIAAEGEASKYISEQLNYVLHHPLNYIGVIINTFKELRVFYANSFVGNLGWLDTNFPFLFIYLFIILLIFLALFDGHSDIKFGASRRISILVLVVTIILLIETSLYLIWTSIPVNGGIGNSIVNGVQGRYFIPCSIVGALVLYSNKSPNLPLFKRTHTLVMKLLPTLALYTCILTIFILIVRYWVPNVGS